MELRVPSELQTRAAYVKGLYQKGLNFPAWSAERTTYHTESMWAFCDWFLPKEFPYKPFHREWMKIAVGQQHFCVLAPRSHSKSTSFGAGYPLWRLYMDPRNTIMLVSSSTAVAELQLRVIKENIETNTRLAEAFGVLKPDDPIKWTNSEIIVNRPPGIGHPSVVALGEGTAILSRRAKFIIADDIVRDDEVQTQEQMQRLRDWIHGVLIGVLESGDQIGFIGTKKSHFDYYADLEQNKRFFFKRYSAIVEIKEDPAKPEEKHWVTLWPEKWPEDQLRERQEIIGTYQFNQNYLNISMAETDSPFPSTWLEKCKDITLSNLAEYPYDDFVKKVVSVDLSLGDTHGTGSFFVAMVTGLRQDGHFVVLHITRERLEFPEQVKRLDRLISNFIPHAVVVESNAYQGAMTSTVAANHPSLEVLAHHTGRNKNDPTEGIPMLQPLVEAGRMHFPYADDTHSREITDILCGELNQLGVARYSDTVMALWFAVKYLAQFVIFTSSQTARAVIV